MFLVKGKKLALGICVLSALSTSVMAAQKKEDKAAEEPLRMPLEREALIDDLTTEKIDRQLFPVDTDGAIDYRQKLLEKERAINAPIVDPEVSFRKITIDPSKKEDNKTVYLSPNYVTTIMFMDKNGSPWPIENYTMALGKNISNNDLNNSSLVFAPKDIKFGRGN